MEDVMCYGWLFRNTTSRKAEKRDEPQAVIQQRPEFAPAMQPTRSLVSKKPEKIDAKLETA